MPIDSNIPQCQHIRLNGTRCGSPALKSKPMCFYHNRMSIPQQLTNFAPFEDADNIQHSIWKVVQGLLSRHIDAKEAGHILYALQLASVNLKNTRNQPYWSKVERHDPVGDKMEEAFAASMQARIDRMESMPVKKFDPKENKAAV